MLKHDAIERLKALSDLTLTPYQILVLGFAALIFLGATLLTLPQATVSGEGTPFIDALFTATSAVCVTGLVVVDTGTYFSLFGQLVVIGLIQIGGLGIMTMTTLMGIMIGKRIQLRERLILQEALNQVTVAGVVRLALYVIKVTFLIEGLGGTILALHWYGEYGLQGIYYGYWHAVSSFCNAGFDLFGNFGSLTRYAEDLTVNLTVTTLIILGGIGFMVMADIWNQRSFRKLEVHSKVAILMSLFLICGGALAFFAFEYDNPAGMGTLSWEGKVLSSYFQSVTARTAGYNTLPMDTLWDQTLFFLIVLMFIGASPASTGGGIKTSTLCVLMASIWAMMRGREEAELFERRIPHTVIYKAFTVVFISASLVCFVTMMMSINESEPFLKLLFEVVSAFGTVGLSTGITPHLSTTGKLWLILTMFAGRVGPVTLVMALTLRYRANKKLARYPEGKFIIG